MHEYRSIDSSEFSSRTKRRVIFELVAILVLGVFFWSPFSSNWPMYIEVSVLVVLISYIVAGIFGYTRAKAIANNFSICVTDNALGFPGNGSMKYLPFGDLSISKVDKLKDEVIAIHLETCFGQSIAIRGLENMNELCHELEEGISRLKKREVS